MEKKMQDHLYSLVETMPPGAEPLTLAEAKLHLRITQDHEDALVSELITQARQMCENYTGLALITRSYSLYIDSWPGSSANVWWDGIREGASVHDDASVLVLPKPPLLSVTKINTYDDNNVATEFSAVNYYVDTMGRPGRIVLKQGVNAPQGSRIANSIEIQFKAGYGATAQSVPALIRQALRLVIAHLYENRGDDTSHALIESGAEGLLQPFRRPRLS